MGSFSIWHLLIFLVIAVLVFGTKRLRNIGGDVGGALRDFKKSLNEPDESERKLKADPPETTSSSSTTPSNHSADR